MEGTNHADAVLYLRVVAVVSARRHGASGAQVNLVAEEREVRPQLRAHLALQHRDLADYFSTPLRRNRRQPLVRVVARQSQRDYGDAAYARVLVGQVSDGLLQNLAVVYLRAQRDVSV